MASTFQIYATHCKVSETPFEQYLHKNDHMWPGIKIGSCKEGIPFWKKISRYDEPLITVGPVFLITPYY